MLGSEMSNGGIWMKLTIAFDECDLGEDGELEVMRWRWCDVHFRSENISIFTYQNVVQYGYKPIWMYILKIED